MSGLFATAGSKMYIGGTVTAKLTDFVLGDYSGQSWVEIGWCENIGQVGDESASIKFDSIGNARTQKLKGVRDAGNQQLVCGIDAVDAGQLLLVAAQATDFNYAFRIDFDDAPAGGTCSARYYIAKVQSAREQLDTANNVAKLVTMLDINSNVVRVAASA